MSTSAESPGTIGPSPAGPSGRLPEIDALRGIAALGIVIFHMKVMTAYDGGVLGLSTPFGRWTNAYLWTCVDLFFVISGFIFAHVYLTDWKLKPGVSTWDYAVARIARIYPLHLVTLVVVAAIAWGGLPLGKMFSPDIILYDGYHFGLNLLMLQASPLNRGFSFNSPSWSLTSEFMCYVLFFLFARAGGRWLTIGAVCAIAVGLTAEAFPSQLYWLQNRLSRALIGFLSACSCIDTGRNS